MAEANYANYEVQDEHIYADPGAPRAKAETGRQKLLIGVILGLLLTLLILSLVIIVRLGE